MGLRDLTTPEVKFVQLSQPKGLSYPYRSFYLVFDAEVLNAGSVKWYIGR